MLERTNIQLAMARGVRLLGKKEATTSSPHSQNEEHQKADSSSTSEASSIDNDDEDDEDARARLSFRIFHAAVRLKRCLNLAMYKIS